MPPPERPPSTEASPLPAGAWPANTFRLDSADRPEAESDKWLPLTEQPAAFVQDWPKWYETAEENTQVVGHQRPPPHALPATWPRAAQYLSGSPDRGCLFTVTLTETAPHPMNIAPYFRGDTCGSVTHDTVHVWPDGVQAQIEASWGEAAIYFYDLGFVHSRGWYSSGQRCTYALSGLAYGARPALAASLPASDPFATRLRAQSCDPTEPPDPQWAVKFGGAAILLPLEGGNRHDWTFRGPVVTVTPFDNWMGQPGWRVCCTVLRDDDTDRKLDIIVTRRVWQSDEPPQVGQDIEGSFWMQGWLLPSDVRA